jgi:diacylglycerol O-acyltransferase/trehalose O-mycolyltransferase
MRRIAWVLVVLASLVPARPAAAEDASCARPRCLEIAVPVPAGLDVPDSHVRVILPVNYHAHHAAYPVLYLLHGAGDTYRAWTDRTDVLAFSQDYRVIIVMPDGGRSPDAGWYSDWVSGSPDWESFHIGVLIPYIDSHFNTLGDGHRAVAGLSMGGFGALSYAARHPELFQAAASFSGAVDTRYGMPVSGVTFKALHDQYGTPDERVWGDQVQNSDVWAAHNPTDRAADLACTELFLASGTGTPGGPAGDDPSNPGGYALEHFIFQMNLSLVRALTLAGVEHRDDFYVGGQHTWPYWQRELHWALPQILDVIGRNGTGGPCAVSSRASLA